MLQPVILLFVLGTCSAVENPGIEITVNNKGLQYGEYCTVKDVSKFTNVSLYTVVSHYSRKTCRC